MEFSTPSAIVYGHNYQQQISKYNQEHKDQKDKGGEIKDNEVAKRVWSREDSQKNLLQREPSSKDLQLGDQPTIIVSDFKAHPT